MKKKPDVALLRTPRARNPDLLFTAGWQEKAPRYTEDVCATSDIGKRPSASRPSYVADERWSWPQPKRKLLTVSTRVSVSLSLLYTPAVRLPSAYKMPNLHRLSVPFVQPSP